MKNLNDSHVTLFAINQLVDFGRVMFDAEPKGLVREDSQSVDLQDVCHYLLAVAGPAVPPSAPQTEFCGQSEVDPMSDGKRYDWFKANEVLGYALAKAHDAGFEVPKGLIKRGSNATMQESALRALAYIILATVPEGIDIYTGRRLAAEDTELGQAMADLHDAVGDAVGF